MKQKIINPFKKNKYEILYEVVNALIAGLIAFLNPLLTSEITMKSIGVSTIIALGIFLYRLQIYFQKEKREYQMKLFNIIG